MTGIVSEPCSIGPYEKYDVSETSEFHNVDGPYPTSHFSSVGLGRRQVPERLRRDG